jgi:hypothetical protein
MVRTDNIGAMFMASSGIRTRHIDTRYPFIREHVEDGLIQIANPHTSLRIRTEKQQIPNVY